jgi:putative tryptophan/tyrosine transport system substrate-binding protein
MRFRVLGFLLMVAVALCSAPSVSSAQQASKVYRIGFLSYAGCPIRPDIMGPFRQGLRELAYVEGQNIIIECRGAPGAADRAPDFAAELVRLTGLSVLTPDMVPKALQILKEAAPSVSRVAVWMDPTNPGHTLVDKQMDAAAKILGVRLERADVRTAANLDAAFAAALRQREEALFVYPLPIALLDVQRIAQFAIKNRLSTIAMIPQAVREGILMSYGPNQAEQYARAGTYIDKILKGAKPGDLPVEQPTKFELVINLKTAKALGLTIPQSLLVRADEVIQ